MEKSHENQAQFSTRSLGWELGIVLLVQTLLVLLVVQLDGMLNLGLGVFEVVGLIFVVLPIVALEWRGRPYERYSIAFGSVKVSLLWTAVCVLAFFPLIGLLGPFFWGVSFRDFSFVWPQGYTGMIAAQFLIVAIPEELFYRGYVLGRLDDIFERRVSFLGVKLGKGFVIQAALFALGHFVIGLHPARLLVFFPALAFGFLRYKTRSLLAPVIFHALSNIFMELTRTGFGLQ